MQSLGHLCTDISNHEVRLHSAILLPGSICMKWNNAKKSCSRVSGFAFNIQGGRLPNRVEVIYFVIINKDISLINMHSSCGAFDICYTRFTFVGEVAVMTVHRRHEENWTLLKIEYCILLFYIAETPVAGGEQPLNVISRALILRETGISCGRNSRKWSAERQQEDEEDVVYVNNWRKRVVKNGWNTSEGKNWNGMLVLLFFFPCHVEFIWFRVM
jgi:hypothetical protein